MKKNYLVLILLLMSCLVHAQDADDGGISIRVGDYHSPAFLPATMKLFLY